MSDDERTIQDARPRRRPAARISLSVVKGPDAGKPITEVAQRRVTLGVSPDNDVVLTDPTVSRYHLELEPVSGGVLVRDLGSSNGTIIAGIRVKEAIVEPGTHLRLGGTVLALEGTREGDEPDDAEEPQVPGIVGVSAAMREVARSVRKLASSDISVLVHGETGTGKELVATALHAESPRKKGPFVTVDCGSLSPTLIASELFGHERGAFTGADRKRAGAFEQANRGTIFLDEIGELPLAVQPALLGALQRRRFRPVGGDREIAIDVRVVCATNRDLRVEVNRGTFRSDLYFRLAVGRIVLPPLRERPEDIEPLVKHFAEELVGRGVSPFDAATMAALRANYWSGNVRELRNVVESAIAMGHLPADVMADGPTPHGMTPGLEEIAPYREARASALERFEREYLERLIGACGGNASEAARRGKMDRPYLLSLLRRHGLRLALARSYRLSAIGYQPSAREPQPGWARLADASPSRGRRAATAG